MSFLNQAQAVAQQATVVAQNIAGNVVRTVAALKLEQYYQPLLNDLTKAATPHFNTLSAAVSKHSGPYMKAAAPYLGEGKTYLDRIPHKETALLLGGIFGGVLLLQLFLMLTATCRRGASKLKAFTPTVFWLLMCFIIHSWIEYSFVFHRNNGQSGFENGMNLYGAADYRYGFGKHMELEAGTAAMEAITAFLSGPLCLFLAWGIVGNKPWRWPLQIVTCTCQIYGLLWFSAHPLFSSEQVASEDPFLYWVIFIGFNAPWGIVPPIMLYSAFTHIYRTLVKAEKNAQVTPGSPAEKKATKKQ